MGHGRLRIRRRFRKAWLRLPEGVRVQVRLAEPSDLNLVLDFLASLSQETLYRRFGRPLARVPVFEARRVVGIAGGWELCLVALIDDERGQRAIGLAQCSVDPLTAIGEVSLLICDEWQGRGLGLRLLNLLVRLAKEAGVTELTGRVSLDNPRMVKLFRALGFKVRLSMEDREYHVKLKVAP